ncbi:MAG: BatA and WFA domain-containing protein, partial [Phycisphaerae bacterium]|nr:BatA and WFA domain-containing protein [Phycisphaerae bacterium]
SSPIMLLGMFLAALPILAHLLSRRTQKRLVFPTVALLAAARASQSQLFRFRRWLLMLLRCLAVFLVAYAFSRPVWVDAGYAGSRDTGEAVVFILDISASTGQRVGGVSLAQTIKETCRNLIGSLRAGTDTANLILARGRPEAAYPAPIRNIDALQQEIAGVEPTLERADLAGALRMARSMIGQGGQPGRIVILSDLQETNWQEAVGLLGAGTAEGVAVRTQVHPVRVGDAVNAALLRPQVFPARPIVGRAAQVLVTVASFADHPRSITVEARLGGRRLGARTAELAPGERRELNFEARFDQPGPHRVTFTLPDDDLAADNQVHLVATAVKRLPVVVVGDDDPARPLGSSYFLARVLAPATGGDNALQVRQVTSASLTDAALQGADVVFIGDIGRLRSAAANTLVRYVHAGGSVAIFCGDGPVADNAAALDAAADQDQKFLPWLPRGPRDLSQETRPLRITEGAWSSRMLASFDEAAQFALADVSFRQIFSPAETAPGAFHLLRFEDGQPAASLRNYGSGRVVLAAFSPTPRSSNLGKHAVFVALAHALTDALPPRRTDRNRTVVGRPLVYTAAATGGADTWQVVAPDDRHPSFSRQVVDGQLQIQLARTEQSGFYEIRHRGKAVQVTATNLDERESDLRPIDLSRLRSATTGQPGTVEVTGTQAGAQDSGPAGKPLWHWFVLLALAVLATELLLVRWWKP